jgi:hypothetical protein
MGGLATPVAMWPFTGFFWRLSSLFWIRYWLGCLFFEGLEVEPAVFLDLSCGTLLRRLRNLLALQVLTIPRLGLLY